MPFDVPDTEISKWLEAAAQGTEPRKLQLLSNPAEAWLEHGNLDGTTPASYICYNSLAEKVTTIEEVYDISRENNLITG